MQVACTIALGTQGIRPPLYEMSGLTIVVLMVIQGICIYVQTQLPSWHASGPASRAMEAGEKRAQAADDIANV